MELFYSTPTQTNGIAFDSKGTMYLSHPVWGDKKTEYQLGYVVRGVEYPFPSKGFNSRLKSVNAIHAYKKHLYVVDEQRVFRISLDGGALNDIYNIQGSQRLNDIRIDGKTAYLTDSGNGTVFELNLTTKESKPIATGLISPLKGIHVGSDIYNHQVNIDGIEFTDNNKALLLTFPAGGLIYKLDLETKKKSVIGSLPPHGGIIKYDEEHILYGDPNHRCIMKYNLTTGISDYVDGSPQLIWPDAMVKDGEYFYVPAARLIGDSEGYYNIFRFKDDVVQR